MVTGDLASWYTVVHVIEAANGTEVEDRINKLMAQLELESDEEEPDETVVGTLLDRGQKVVTQATVAP